MLKRKSQESRTRPFKVSSGRKILFVSIVLAFAAGIAGRASTQVADEEPRSGCGPGSPAHCYTPGDFDGDLRADLAMFRPEEGVWYVMHSLDNQPTAVHWGMSGDKLVSADYDGDRIDDYAVYRPSVGIWYVRYSSDGSGLYKEFGGINARPAPGDYDGDGRADFAVVKRGVYEILQSSDEKIVTIRLPTSDRDESEDSNHNDINVPGDYDGDGETDPAIFDEQSAQLGDEPAHPGGPRVWIILRSTAGLVSVSLGEGDDVPVPGDYNGDGKTDVAVWHPNGDWSIIENLDEGSTAHSVRVVHWGSPGDLVAPGDYDGDGKTDLAVWRPDDAIWHILLSESNRADSRSWGLSGDIPIPMVLKRAD